MRIRQALFVLCMLLAAPAGAAGDVSLAAVLEAARANLDVSLAGSALAAARADIAAADHGPAPVLTTKAGSIDLQNGVGGGPLTRRRIDKSVGIDFTWERGGKRALRTEAAERAALAARADIDEIRVQQQVAANAAFFDLLSAQERVEATQALAQSALQLADAAARRLKAGDLSMQDATRSEIEAERARADVQSARLDGRRAALALSQLTGLALALDTVRVRADWPPIDAADPAPVLVGTELDHRIAARADVIAAQARLEAARAAVELAQAQKKADITWGTSIDHFPGTSTRQVEFRLQVPLQWNYRFEGEIGRALAQVDIARDTLEKTRLAARLEIQRLAAESQVSAARARSYETEILPRARRVAAMADLAYGKGALSLTDLIEARRTLRATLAEALAARVEHAKALGAWQLRATGT